MDIRVIVFLLLLFRYIASENNFTDIQKLQMKFENEVLLAKFPPSRVEELANGIEGDMLTKNRNGLLFKAARWDNGIIPFEIVGPYTSEQLTVLFKVFEYYRNNTCITFRPKTKDDANYVSIVNDGTGCSSFVGRTGGAQEMKLSDVCFLRFGTVAHEFMHVLGFTHEQNRSDRNNYINVNFKNIKKIFWNNFTPGTAKSVSAFGIPYDYQSVMHYSSTAFSRNNKETITPKYPQKAELMGQRYALTNYDLSKILKMYCEGTHWRTKMPFPYVRTEFDN